MNTRSKYTSRITGAQSSQVFKRTLTHEAHARYLLFLPRDCQPRASKSWPLIFFLHGAGERGDNLAKVANHGPPKLVKKQPDFPFIVASPQCPAGESWTRATLLALLDQLLDAYPVDPSRVYLTGLSMGGYAAWDLASACPERFAAVAPICGGGDILPILLAESRRLRTLRALPVWAFHGARDNIVPLHESERMVKALRDIGNPARLTVYPDAEHDAWTDTYNNPALLDWFLSHRRRARR